VFELGREAKKSPGGLRLLKKTGVSGDCVRDDAAGGVLGCFFNTLRSY
jgi:hypothetical protein